MSADGFEPFLPPQESNDTPEAWLQSIREDLLYFSNYFEYEENSGEVNDRRAEYSKVLTAIERAIQGNLEEAHGQSSASILLQCLQTLKFWKKLYHAMLAKRFNDYRPTEAKRENLNKLIGYIEGLFLKQLSPHLQEEDIYEDIATALGKNVSDSPSCPPYLMELYQNETISAKQFYIYCAALICTDSKPLFNHELQLLAAFEEMHASSCHHEQLKEMAFRLLKEEKISEFACLKVAKLLLQGEFVSFEEIHKVLLQETLFWFESQNTEDEKFARKRDARLDAFPKNLDSKATKKQLALQLCHDALWLEAKLGLPFFDIAMSQLEALYSDDELPTEYHYLYNLRTLQRPHFQEIGGAESEEDLTPYETLQEFDAIVQEADFSEEDKEKAYAEANRLMKAKQPLRAAGGTRIMGDGIEEIDDPSAELPSGIFATLSPNVKRDARTFGSLGRGAGIASMAMGAGLIVGGILGIAASIASAFVTLGVGAPLAFFGVWANLGFITAGIAMFKGGQILRDAGEKQYKEGRYIQKRWDKVSERVGAVLPGPDFDIGGVSAILPITPRSQHSLLDDQRGNRLGMVSALSRTSPGSSTPAPSTHGDDSSLHLSPPKSSKDSRKASRNIFGWLQSPSETPQETQTYQDGYVSDRRLPGAPHRASGDRFRLLPSPSGTPENSPLTPRPSSHEYKADGSSLGLSPPK